MNPTYARRPVYTVKGVAKIAGVSRQRIQQLIGSGDLKTIRIDGHPDHFILQAELDRLLAEWPDHKVTEEQIALIRERYAAGDVSQQALANEYSISRTYVSLITRTGK